jgi:NitT/TauT family transport system ATP-binding protein
MRNDIILQCEALAQWFGDNKVLFDINLQIERGQVVGVVGPSGCGKSTLLRAIVGTHPARGGDIFITDGEGTKRIVLEPGRDRGIVYQRYSLFPFKTARENVAVGPILDQTSISSRIFGYFKFRHFKEKVLAEADTLLTQMGLGHALRQYPAEMSGGMRQRVAIAQALIMRPAILLLDEPFGALDEATREDLQRLLLGLYRENQQARDEGMPAPHTIFIVTHELNEALYVGDRVLGLSQHWDWKAEGFERCPGATIIYDKSAPVFEPEAPRDFESLRTQRAEIRRLVFEPEVPTPRHVHVTFSSVET